MATSETTTTPGPIAVIPGFRSSRQLDPPVDGAEVDDLEETATSAAGPETELGTSPQTDLTTSRGRWSMPGIPRPDADPRTLTSSAGKAPKPSTAETARLVAGLLGLAVAGVALVVRWRGRDLRRPTKTQVDDIAAPVARILMRHVDPLLLSPDLADAALAGSAVGAYLTDGPLLQWLPEQAGLPDPEGEL